MFLCLSSILPCRSHGSLYFRCSCSTAFDFIWLVALIFLFCLVLRFLPVAFACRVYLFTVPCFSFGVFFVCLFLIACHCMWLRALRCFLSLLVPFCISSPRLCCLVSLFVPFGFLLFALCAAFLSLAFCVLAPFWPLVFIVLFIAVLGWRFTTRVACKNETKPENSGN